MGLFSRAVTIAVALMAFPLAQAAHVELAIAVSGPVSFTPSASAQLAPLGAIVQNVSGITSFHLNSPGVTLCVYKLSEVDALVLNDVARVFDPTSTSQACYPLTNVEVTLAAPAERGWLGIVAQPDSTMQIPADTLQASYHTVLSSSDQQLSGSERTDGLDETAASPTFHREFIGPNVNGTGTGIIAFQGAGAIKFMGLSVTVTASENTTTIKTRDVNKTTTPYTSSRSREWVYLSFSHANATIDTTTPVLVAASRVMALHVEGKMQYEASKDIEGNLSGSAAPSFDGRQLDVLLSGDVRSTNVAALHVSPMPGDLVRSPWLPLTLLGAVVASGGGALIVSRYKSRRVRLVEPRPRRLSHAERAELAADSGEFRVAADLWARARRDDPKKPGFALEEGICRYFADEPGHAIEAFDAASREKDDGEAELWSALCAVAMGDEDLAETYLVRALDREPTREVLACFWDDEEFAGLRARDSVHEAWRRLGGDSSR